jgi:IS5 family transposase
MKPKKIDTQGRIFETPLEDIINMKHPLVLLSHQINWASLEETFGNLYVPDVGRPGLPTRLIVGLHYLKYAFNYSDEAVVATFLENPYWQYFCGKMYFEHDLPIDPSSMTRWRKRLDKSDSEALLKETIETAIRTKALATKDVNRVNVDTTVQEKNVSYPTDAKNYNKARKVLVRIAKRCGIKLRQSYARKGEEMLRKQGQYAHARQMKRAQKATRQLRNYLGRIIREVERGSELLTQQERKLLLIVTRLHEQKREDKNKVYSLHAPEVECISKGKAHKKYEFGCKASFVSTNKSNWILGATACHGTPYDGNTLSEALAQVKRLSGHEVKEAYCDKGYRLKKEDKPKDCQLYLSGQRGLSKAEKTRLRRRNAIEPLIGHMKMDHRLCRNYLLGVMGDIQNAMFSACGFNIRKLLRAFLYPHLRSISEAFSWIKSLIEDSFSKFVLKKFLPNSI